LILPTLSLFTLSLAIIESHILFIYLKSWYWVVPLRARDPIQHVKFCRTFISLVEVAIHLVLLRRLVWIFVVVLSIASLFWLHLVLNGIDFIIFIPVFRNGPWILLDVSLLFLILVPTVWLLHLIIFHIAIFRWWIWHLAVQIVIDNRVHLVHGRRW